MKFLFLILFHINHCGYFQQPSPRFICDEHCVPQVSLTQKKSNYRHRRWVIKAGARKANRVTMCITPLGKVTCRTHATRATKRAFSFSKRTSKTPAVITHILKHVSYFTQPKRAVRMVNIVWFQTAKCAFTCEIFVLLHYRETVTALTSLHSK